MICWKDLYVNERRVKGSETNISYSSEFVSFKVLVVSNEALSQDRESWPVSVKRTKRYDVPYN